MIEIGKISVSKIKDLLSDEVVVKLDKRGVGYCYDGNTGTRITFTRDGTKKIVSMIDKEVSINGWIK